MWRVRRSISSSSRDEGGVKAGVRRGNWVHWSIAFYNMPQQKVPKAGSSRYDKNREGEWNMVCFQHAIRSDDNICQARGPAAGYEGRSCSSRMMAGGYGPLVWWL